MTRMNHNTPDYALMLRSISKIASSMADIHPSEMDKDLKKLILSAHEALENCAQSINSPAPVFRLPPELLALMFSTAQDMTEDFEELSQSRKVPLPITLSHVCSVWREVTTTTPLLWTKIAISPPWNLNMVRLWLSRSGSCPIDLHIAATGELWLRTGRFMSLEYRNFPAEDRAYGLWDTLMYHIPRCRTIVVEAHDVFYPIVRIFRDELRDLSASFPFLEMLSLQGHIEFMSDYGRPQDILSLGAPALRDVKVGLPFRLQAETYNHITTLHLQVAFMTFTDLPQFLSNCNALQSLAIYDDFADRWADISSSSSSSSVSLSIPSLKTLQLYNTTTNQILSSLSAPALESLAIAPVTASDLHDYYQQQSRAGASRAFPSLTEVILAFDEYWPDDNSLETATRCFPDITSAVLVGECAQYITQTLEVNSSEATYPWPKLRSLSIRGSDWCGTGSRLRSLVVSRLKSDTPLDRLFVDGKARLFDLEWLEKHIDIVERDSWGQLRQHGLYYPCIDIC